MNESCGQNVQWLYRICSVAGQPQVSYMFGVNFSAATNVIGKISGRECYRRLYHKLPGLSGEDSPLNEVKLSDLPGDYDCDDIDPTLLQVWKLTPDTTPELLEPLDALVVLRDIEEWAMSQTISLEPA